MPRHPIQPLELDGEGVLRFKRNAIVCYLLDNGGIDMNKLAMLDFPREMASISAREMERLRNKLAAAQDHRDRALDLLIAALRFKERLPSDWVQKAELAVSATS